MLIKLFGVPETLQTRELLNMIRGRLETEGFSYGGVRLGFSPVSIRAHGAEGPLRILVTGSDAHGRERSIKHVVAKTCATYYKLHSVPWLGYEDPQLPGQPGESRGRSL